ncbi:ABC transporter permease [Ornithinimicrobium faecis]|uniref:Transport permease protein n=1 Tax=Ornithinimicrobium faecis TaxID=2934158 RepID=A0ABY4YVH6_9MICO|nr:ABC transporter permease [Ornithinimicrobium sp. HY1793]USQ80172.1 ABC transporter permease [Ornithinimicrobium sp. HY1793]
MPEPTMHASSGRVSSGRVSTARVITAAARGALADLRTIYTPFTWTVGWLGRIIMQVIFFALIGTLLGSREAVIYLFVGQAVMATVTECFMAIPSTTWERRTGTLALLTAAPGPLWPVFVGRSLQWLPSGVATGSIVLLAVGPFFGVTWSLGAGLLLVPALAVVAVSMYAVALTLAAVVLRGPRWRNVVSNLSVLVVMLLSGATVPVTTWPNWLQALAQVLPVTHGLEAIRVLEVDGVVREVWPPLGLALVLGAGWFVVAGCAFTLFGEAGRRDGTIDFAE